MNTANAPFIAPSVHDWIAVLKNVSALMKSHGVNVQECIPGTSPIVSSHIVESRVLALTTCLYILVISTGTKISRSSDLCFLLKIITGGVFVVHGSSVRIAHCFASQGNLGFEQS